MNLLMLTKFYPFGTDEAFVENEVKILSEYYDEITIVACEVARDEKRVRETPSNVNVVRVNAGNRFSDALKGCLRSGLSKGEELRAELRYCKGLKRKAFLYYFEEKCRRVFTDIIAADCLKKITEKPYVIYSYWLFMTARVGTMIAAEYPPQMMFTRCHRYDLYEERNSLNYLPYRRFLLDAYDDILPCSENGAHYLREKYPAYEGKIKPAFLGTIDHGLGSCSEDGSFRIVSCSRIAPEKRVNRIIAALKLLDSSEYKIEWHHIGDGKGLSELRELSTHLQTVRCVFHGNIQNTEVLKKYAERPFDLFVNVSESEGLPVSIMEAMSFGMPVIATDVGGTNEIVLDGGTGKLLDEHFTDETLAEELRHFIEMKKEEYAAYRSRCRGKWEEAFCAHDNYRRLFDYLANKKRN